MTTLPLPYFEFKIFKQSRKGSVMAQKQNLSSLLNLIPKTCRPQSADMNAWVLWSAASVVGTFWLIQPFDWLTEQIIGSVEKK